MSALVCVWECDVHLCLSVCACVRACAHAYEHDCVH